MSNKSWENVRFITWTRATRVHVRTPTYTHHWATATTPHWVYAFAYDSGADLLHKSDDQFELAEDFCGGLNSNKADWKVRYCIFETFLDLKIPFLASSRWTIDTTWYQNQILSQNYNIKSLRSFLSSFQFFQHSLETRRMMQIGPTVHTNIFAKNRDMVLIIHAIHL